MFGVQWDLVLKYIQMKKEATVTDIKTKLNSNSTPIGNYNNNQWNVTNTNAKYSTDYGKSFTACTYSKTSNASILLTTGADESFSLMNIYDIAGNVWEWILEKTSDDGSPCASRGGGFYDSGSSFPASYRGISVTSCSIYSIGFRVSLY